MSSGMTHLPRRANGDAYWSFAVCKCRSYRVLWRGYVRERGRWKDGSRGGRVDPRLALLCPLACLSLVWCHNG